MHETKAFNQRILTLASGASTEVLGPSTNRFGVIFVNPGVGHFHVVPNQPAAQGNPFTLTHDHPVLYFSKEDYGDLVLRPWFAWHDFMSSYHEADITDTQVQSFSLQNNAAAAASIPSSTTSFPLLDSAYLAYSTSVSPRLAATISGAGLTSTQVLIGDTQYLTFDRPLVGTVNGTITVNLPASGTAGVNGNVAVYGRTLPAPTLGIIEIMDCMCKNEAMQQAQGMIQRRY